MILNGKEIRVLLGALTVAQHIPLSRTDKRNLSEKEISCMEKLFDRIMTSTETEYQRIGAEKFIDENTVKMRLTISISCSLSELETNLVRYSLGIYISEAEARKSPNSLNVYYGGDVYGLDVEDFRNLSKKMAIH